MAAVAADNGVVMNLNEALRLLAGIVVIASVILAKYVHPNFIWLTFFVGLNLLQSAFTKWCPAMWFFRKIGLKDC